MKTVHLTAPISKADVSGLEVGDRVYLSGTILTARDAAHKRLCDTLAKGEQLPVNLQGETIYYVGPCRKDGKVISAGPTTSMRMDKFAPILYDEGVLATIGKGDRNEQVYDAIAKNGAVYFAAIGGAGALCTKTIKSSTTLCYEDLGTEAICAFEVKNFPCIVAIDSKGNSIYKK